ncbi:hypothetical protein [Ponticaulis sp.]|uniref:hypothetical protein n=1 Tax=Ponticaulis sp. TaxID=2020902 RepID=UPI000B6DCFA8|nr:hypothetical protein [Ponticaulis sp.]MAI91757.1 hypothetical protein [Ponticaulis sp.]OUX97015.1 MAG: hypothetical protein CBB65_15070 [Hyphomonadaceae bacterium TMED5]|tara:strand:+ start:18915 stop:19994 length:1080 start_codon:yes stop_codon:yes gene_type:complete
MKTSALFASLSALALITACSQDHDATHEDHDRVADDHHETDDHHDDADDHHGNDHGHDEDHLEAGDHHDGGNHHAHDDQQSATLGFAIDASPAVGAPFSVGLILTDAAGNELTAADLDDMHGYKLHVMLVDTGLEQLVTLHPEADDHGEFTIEFTPEYGREYKVFANYIVTHGEISHADDHGHAHDDDHGHAHEEDEHSHGGDDHAHDDVDDHAHDDDHAHAADEKVAGYTQATSALIIGTDSADALPTENVLSITEGDLTFSITPSGPLESGTATGFTLTASQADGTAFTDFETVMGTQAHFAAFDASAEHMSHGHATDSGDGPSTELTFSEAGPHRVFVMVGVAGETLTLPFTVQVE